MIHKNNHVHTTREGYVLREDVEAMKEIAYTGPGSIAMNLSQGMYKVKIDGTMYVFLLHDTLSGSDKIIINDKDDAFTIISATRHKLYLYKLNEGTEFGDFGYKMFHTVNDRIDLLVIDGYTAFEPEKHIFWDFDHPCKIDFTSTYNIQIRDKDGAYQDLVFSTRAYLKSMKVDGNKEHDLHDRIFMDGALNRAIIHFKLGRILLAGYEPFELVNKYSDAYTAVYYYPTKVVRAGSKVCCSHLRNLTWEEMTDPYYTKEGICAGPTVDTQGFYIKVNREKFPDLQSLRDKLMYWYTARSEDIEELRRAEYEAIKDNLTNVSYEDYLKMNPVLALPVTVEYQLTNYEFRQLTLDSYYIPTLFNRTYLTIHPYKLNHYTRQMLNNVVGLVPKNGIIKSMAEQERESGNTEYYYRILEENRMLRDLVTKYEFTDRLKIDLDGNIVGVVPLDGEIPNSIEQEEDSGKPDKYQKILNENRILRSLFSLKNEQKMPTHTIDSSYLIALIPKNGIIPSFQQQNEESGYAEYYDKTIDENYIIRNMSVMGEYYVHAMYFYKHLRLE